MRLKKPFLSIIFLLLFFGVYIPLKAQTAQAPQTADKAGYAALNEKPEGVYQTNSDGKFFFKYEEKYNPATTVLNYKIYTWQRIDITPATIVLQKNNGMNWYTLDLKSSGGFSYNNY